MYPFLPWELLAIAPLPPLPPPAPPPTPSTLPVAGEHVVDPDRSTATLTIRRFGRRDRLTGTVSGLLRADRSVGHLVLDVASTIAGPRSGDVVPLRLTGTDLAAVHGEWLLHCRAEFDDARVPLPLWLGPADHRPDGSTRLTATGTFDGRRAGHALPRGFGRVHVEIALTTRVRRAAVGPRRPAGLDRAAPVGPAAGQDGATGPRRPRRHRKPAGAGLSRKPTAGAVLDAMTAVRSPELVGRRAELATAVRMVFAADRGDGGTLLVTGEAGIGKSRLVAEIRSRAAAAGRPSSPVEPSRAGAPTGRWPRRWPGRCAGRQLLDTARLRPFRAALNRLLPAATVAEPDPGRGPPVDPSVVLGEGVLALLAEAAGERGCLLVLEDLHWADPDTVDLVRYLTGAVRGTPVLLVLTARDDVPQPGVSRLVTAPDVTVVGLARLDDAGVGALAAACRGGAPLTDAELRDLVTRSDGLPFLVEELLGTGTALVAGSADAGGPRRRAAGGAARR